LLSAYQQKELSVVGCVGHAEALNSVGTAVSHEWPTESRLQNVLLTGPCPDINVDEMCQLRRLFVSQRLEEPLDAAGRKLRVPEYLPYTASANEVLSIQSR
jgi:hypothetical protein